GRWRSAGCARRLGPAAVDLDRLIWRDGRAVDEAVALVHDRYPLLGRDTLRGIAEQLPPRTRARTVVPEDLSALRIGGFEDPVECEQDVDARRRLLRILRGACRQLSAEERRILYLRFG